MSAAAAARIGTTVALVGAGVALLVKGFFFTYSSAGIGYVALAVLCAALCGTVDYAAERRAGRARAVAAAAILAIFVSSWAIYIVWFATHYRD